MGRSVNDPTMIPDSSVNAERKENQGSTSSKPWDSVPDTIMQGADKGNTITFPVLPKGFRWADDVEWDDDPSSYYDSLKKSWDDKLVPNVSRTGAGTLRVKLPEGLASIPFVKNLSSAMQEHNIETYWDPSIQVQSSPELLEALEDDAEKLGIYVDKIFQILNTAAPSGPRARSERRILEGLYCLRELRAVMRNFQHVYSGSLEGKPPSVDWTMELRLETIWELVNGEERSNIHYLINSHPYKDKVKTSLTNLFGESASNQLVDGYEIAFRQIIRNVYNMCKEHKPELATKMVTWFYTHVNPRMPSHWSLLQSHYQVVKTVVPLSSSEKQRIADSKPTARERKEFLESRPTKVLNKRILPIIDHSLITTVSGKKAANAWNNAFTAFSEEEKSKRVDPKRTHSLPTLIKNVSEMRKFTTDVFLLFRKHCKALRDDLFTKIKADKGLNRRSAEKAVITAFEFNTELNRRKPELELKENDLLVSFCAYLPMVDLASLKDDTSASVIESHILSYLRERYEGCLYYNEAT